MTSYDTNDASSDSLPLASPGENPAFTRLRNIIAGRDDELSWLWQLRTVEAADLRKYLVGLRYAIDQIVRENEAMKGALRDQAATIDRLSTNPTMVRRHADSVSIHDLGHELRVAEEAVDRLAERFDRFVGERRKALAEAGATRSTSLSRGLPARIDRLLNGPETVDPKQLRAMKEDLDRVMVLKALVQADFKKSHAARTLNISRPTLDAKIRAFALDDEIEAGKADPWRYQHWVEVE